KMKVFNSYPEDDEVLTLVLYVVQRVR
ncbi:hypothetical protein A2U01_0062272, partial [Trifolium medium]|nr:hypothetical protein [Trifolium medium]